MSPAGTVTILYAFTDGLTAGVPGPSFAPLIQATDGNFYGTTATSAGIHTAYGAVFRNGPCRLYRRSLANSAPGYPRCLHWLASAQLCRCCKVRCVAGDELIGLLLIGSSGQRLGHLVARGSNEEDVMAEKRV
jgi:hypothetical protein